MIQTLLAIAAFGTLGCWARFGQTLLMQNLFGREFPIAVLSINVIGSFLIGFLFFETLDRLTLGPAIRTGILTGFLGGYTTFSTFELETLLLAENGEVLKAASYVILSVGIGLIAVFSGAYLARNL
ncbi:fluoride efflux transporter CrcB [Acidiphilium acidophilum]|uniref:fluoride efflux transporter CrcB n=1 Tax=Acidiphilium acidophilum TaxID=76588 RepID=UPI002E8E72CC|nr:fluoride efflux transporter CrcB [Acidiphilium acidophilum]